MLTLGTHSTASFLGLSHLSHSVHFLGMKKVARGHFPWFCATTSVCSRPAVLAAGRQHMTPKSFRPKIQLYDEVAKSRVMFRLTDSKMLSWRGFKPGLLRPQCRELTTIRPQATTGSRLEIWPTACLSDAERELKSLLGTSKKDSHFSLAIRQTGKSARFEPGGETPMEF